MLVCLPGLAGVCVDKSGVDLDPFVLSEPVSRAGDASSSSTSLSLVCLPVRQ